MNCYIWSNEHRAWWRKDSRGYVYNQASAGVYSLEEATAICNGANRGIDLDENPPNEFIVPILDDVQTLAVELAHADCELRSITVETTGANPGDDWSILLPRDQVRAALKRNAEQVELLMRLRDEAQREADERRTDYAKKIAELAETVEEIRRERDRANAFAAKWRDEYDVKVAQLLGLKARLDETQKRLGVCGLYAEELRDALSGIEYDSDDCPVVYPSRERRDELIGLTPIVESAIETREPLIRDGHGSPFCGSGDPRGSQDAQDAVVAREGSLTVIRPRSHRHRVLAGFLAHPEGLRQIDAGQIALEQYSVGANTEAGPNTGRRRCTDLAALGLIQPVADYEKSARWAITTDGIAAMKLLDAGEAWRLNGQVPS
jgi:hypothetical protein